ncbi:MAG: hypothetical protein H0U49_09510 [Parachlamydiaceae bacterium]|nr:hypothetical protein [Parachlamydiaceae bacterium]
MNSTSKAPYVGFLNENPVFKEYKAMLRGEKQMWDYANMPNLRKENTEVIKSCFKEARKEVGKEIFLQNFNFFLIIKRENSNITTIPTDVISYIFKMKHTLDFNFYNTSAFYFTVADNKYLCRILDMFDQKIEEEEKIKLKVIDDINKVLKNKNILSKNEAFLVISNR